MTSDKVALSLALVLRHVLRLRVSLVERLAIPELAVAAEGAASATDRSLQEFQLHLREKSTSIAALAPLRLSGLLMMCFMRWTEELSMRCSE
jgi:hypothetical protein